MFNKLPHAKQPHKSYLSKKNQLNKLTVIFTLSLTGLDKSIALSHTTNVPTNAIDFCFEHLNVQFPLPLHRMYVVIEGINKFLACLSNWWVVFYVRGITFWASYQIRNITGCACAGNAGNVFLVTDFKESRLLAIVTHVPWCMSGSLTRGGGENVPGIPGACATCNFTYLARGPCTLPMMHVCTNGVLVLGFVLFV